MHVKQIFIDLSPLPEEREFKSYTPQPQEKRQTAK